MNDNQQKNHLIDRVLGKIKSGQVKMRPKAYFVFRMILLSLGFLILFLFIVYLTSLVTFFLRASGALFLPKFGFSGLGIFFSSLPWLLILVVASLIIALEVFSKRFTFVYRRPILYSLLLILFIVVLGSFLVDRTPFHSNLFWKAQEGKLPGMGPIYRDFGAGQLEKVHHGIVSEVTEDSFLIETPAGEVFRVVIAPQARLLSGAEVKEGETVVILGKKEGEEIEAFAIRQVKKDLNLFPLRQMPGPKPFKR